MFFICVSLIPVWIYFVFSFPSGLLVHTTFPWLCFRLLFCLGSPFVLDLALLFHFLEFHHPYLNKDVFVGILLSPEVSQCYMTELELQWKHLFFLVSTGHMMSLRAFFFRNWLFSVLCSSYNKKGPFMIYAIYEFTAPDWNYIQFRNCGQPLV